MSNHAIRTARVDAERELSHAIIETPAVTVVLVMRRERWVPDGTAIAVLT